MVFLCGASSRGEQASPLRRAFSTSVLSRGLDDRSSFFELTQAQPTWRDKKSHGEASRCPSDHACRGGVTVPLSILHYRTRFLTAGSIEDRPSGTGEDPDFGNETSRKASRLT